MAHRNGEVNAYVCDGSSVSEWFKGSAQGNSLDLTSKGGARLVAELSQGSASGAFTPAGGGLK